MAFGDVAGDSEADVATAGMARARLFQAHTGVKDGCELVLGNPWAFVRDADENVLAAAFCRDVADLDVFDGVVDEIGETAAEIVGASR